MKTIRITFAQFSAALLLTGCTVVAPTVDDTSLENDPVITDDSASSAAIEEESEVPTLEVKLGDDGKIEGEVVVQPFPPKIIRITAENWKFEPSEIRVQQGQNVTLELVGINGSHGFAIPELGINVTVEAGQTLTLLLNTDTAGEFSFFCSIPCGAGHNDMKGTIIIEQ